MSASQIGNILVVDDEVELKNVLVEALVSQGYRTTGLPSGVEALAAIRTEAFDVVLTDLVMPGMDGVTLIQNALQMDPHLVCIVMTGQGTIQTAVDAMKVGAFDYVQKPFRVEALLPLVRRAVEVRKMRLENSHLRETVAMYELAQTTREELEQQLRQSQKMEAIGRLAGGVAHDFNNLLTAINGYSSLALQRTNPDDRLRGYLEEIKKAGERAATLTRQLLAFGRKQMLKPVVLNLNDVVSDMNKMLRRLIGEDIRFMAKFDPELKPIKADPGQIEQVLVNLVVNSRDAMPQGGSLTIETANFEIDAEFAGKHLGLAPGHYVMLAVSDSGCGMDDKTQARIFEPFFTTKEKGRGTGLGLSTVYGIVKQSGGSVWVYSEPDKGTVFKVYFPQLQEDEGFPKPVSVETPVPRGSETILLVEDEDVVRGLARKILEQAGYYVLDTRGAEEAIRLCHELPGPIHLLLTDVVMPERSGKEIAECLAKLRPSTRVLYMSGYTDDAIVHHGVLDSDVEFIQKPFTPIALARKVREVLDSKNGRHQAEIGEDATR
jgi:two-component system, cell cycle sensor histidine kinase and response regulator CckA